MSAFLSALTGKCPACGRGRLYKAFLKLHETCPDCHVRFERWEGSWTIPTVMGYSTGALFAVALGYVFWRMDRLEGAENIIIPATLAFTALTYPICKNISVFLLWNNGFIFVDPPTLVQDDGTPAPPEAPRDAPRAAPQEAPQDASPTPPPPEDPGRAA